MGRGRKKLEKIGKVLLAKKPHLLYIIEAGGNFCVIASLLPNGTVCETSISERDTTEVQTKVVFQIVEMKSKLLIKCHINIKCCH
jgi:hypothetical protein